MADFDWHSGKDDDAIVLGYQPPTAVYSNKAGNIIIRQKADETEEYDPQVFLTPQGALAVAWRLIEEAHLVGLPEPSASLMVESANWPPPSRRTDDPYKAGMAKRAAEPDSDEPALLAAMNKAAE